MQSYNYTSLTTKYPALIKSARILLALTFVTFIFVTLNQSLYEERRSRAEEVLLDKPAPALFALQDDTQAEGPIVEVTNGRLRGKVMKSRGGREFNAFYRIPYAQPPTGEYKFQVK